MQIYDYIIVGGGSAGSILASRLSARSAIRVMLCEAGEDTADGRVPDEILDSRSGVAARGSRFIWHQLQVTTETRPHNDPSAPRPRLVRYEQARVLGGGSSINGQLANRGAPHDYDEWERRGANGWNWQTVLPYFKKIERDIDFDGPLHGSDGRIPVRRVFPDNWSDYAKAVAEAFKLAGYRYVPDQNGEFQDGYYPLAMSNLYDQRVSAAVGYLGPTVRHRDNLTVMTNVQVSELLFEGARCVGIRALMGGQVVEYRGNEVIVCCGAIHSPAMLLRAGIGPVGHLRDLDITVRASRPGVGQRLMDHPSISVASFLKPGARNNRYSKRSLHLGMRFSSGIDGAPSGDMALTVSNKSAWHAIGDRIAVITLWVNKTFSDTGQVRLASVDWRQEPEVDFNLLSDYRDLQRLARGFRQISDLHELPPLKAVTSDAFPASFTDKIRRVSTYNSKNRILTRLGATLMDGPAFLRRYVIRGFIMESANLVQALKDDETLENYIRRAAVGVWHCSCSCRMGAADDPMAVTDNEGRVYGVQGLRVVDASIFPVVPCANTNFPTMMAAEKIADEILRTRPVPRAMQDAIGAA
ncbi:MAG TPA: GMC family oxidoreductase N-terminal domain-containing protein [Acetobacteraceae bacterium]|nr:GMC family oxidoreductase N-terminal domain-containing protein [Acetobacteraceae bacterium]